MFRNYLKIALRNFKRHAGFAAINIAGLSLGITACLLIAAFVWDEKQYDQFIPGKENIYRVYNQRTTPEEATFTAGTPPMYAPHLQQNYPEIETTTRIIHLQSKSLFEANGKKIYEENGILADSTFFNIFPLELKWGSTERALEDKTSIIISESLSQKLYGNENPVGKTIVSDKDPYLIKAVIKDNARFHTRINFIHTISVWNLPAERMASWQYLQFNTYVKLKEGSKAAPLEAKFQEYIRKEIHPLSKATSGSSILPFLQPLTDIHLHSANFKFDFAVRGNITYVKALSIVAIFILLIACFNFINLSTAKSLQRAKEVGVRKSIGASRKQLVLQFTGETILLTFLSLIISFVAFIVLLPSLNAFTGKSISLNHFIQPGFISLLFLSAFVIGIIAGFYPAMVLSGFKPITVLKQSVTTGGKSGSTQWLRKGLVVVQFMLSALLIVSAIIVYQQVNFLHNKDLGFNKEEIMFFPMQGDNMYDNQSAFKNEILNSPGISAVSIGYGFPGDMFAGDEIMVPKDGQLVTSSATQLMVDYDYIKTLGLKIVAGRDFSREISTDIENFIINETAVRELGFQTPEKAIGKQLMWNVWNNENKDTVKKGIVVGVVKDFNYKSLYDKVEIAILQIYPPAAWKVAVKIKTADLEKSVAHVKTVWAKFSPEYPIEYKFMDENFEAYYKSEDKLKSLLLIFTIVAIFIGCMGLFGLAAYAAERRTKEIGIRKILGASVNGIVLLLSKDFLKLVVISLIIASPIAWYFMSKWLQDFAYRVEIKWWVFAIAGGFALSIALLTVSYQSLKAAFGNPVKSLRTE